MPLANLIFLPILSVAEKRTSMTTQVDEPHSQYIWYDRPYDFGRPTEARCKMAGSGRIQAIRVLNDFVSDASFPRDNNRHKLIGVLWEGCETSDRFEPPSSNNDDKFTLSAERLPMSMNLRVSGIARKSLRCFSLPIFIGRRLLPSRKLTIVTSRRDKRN